jgi:hypothetical protein
MHLQMLQAPYIEQIKSSCQNKVWLLIVTERSLMRGSVGLGELTTVSSSNVLAACILVLPIIKWDVRLKPLRHPRLKKSGPPPLVFTRACFQTDTDDVNYLY